MRLRRKRKKRLKIVKYYGAVVSASLPRSRDDPKRVYGMTFSALLIGVIATEEDSKVSIEGNLPTHLKVILSKHL